MGWIVVAGLIGAALVDALHDPRKLRIGVLLLLAASLAGAAGFAHLVLLVVDSDEPIQLAWVILELLGLALLGMIALGVASVANGVTMVRREGRRPANLLSLLFGLAVLAYVAGIGAVWLLDTPGTQEIAVGLFFWLVLLGIPVAYLAFVFVAFVGYGLLYGAVVRRWGRPVDAVIVLGAGLIGDRVTPLLASRLDRGHEVLDRSRRRGRDTVIITSGGQGPDEVVPEAVAMAGHLVENGVDPALIRLEDRSTTTEENLRFSAEVAGEGGVQQARFAVVTNGFHSFRAALLMRKVGLDGYATGSPTARYFWPSAILREYVAVLRDHRWLNGIVLALLCLPLLAFAIGSLT